MSDFLIHQSVWSQTHVRKDFRRSIVEMPQVIQPTSFWWAPFGHRKVWGSYLFGVSSNEMVSLIEVEEACTKIIWFWIFFVIWHNEKWPTGIQERWRGLKVLVKRRSVVIHYQAHNRSSLHLASRIDLSWSEKEQCLTARCRNRSFDKTLANLAPLTRLSGWPYLF